MNSTNSTCPGRVFFVLSHQVLKEKGRYPPPKTPRSCPTATTPQQSQKLLSIFIPHVMSRLYIGGFLSIQCVSQLLTPCIVLILHRLITYPTGSLANTDVHVWRLQPIPPPHHPSYQLHTTRTRLTQRRVLTPVPPATSLGGSCSPRPCPRLPRPTPQHHRLRIKNE